MKKLLLIVLLVLACFLGVILYWKFVAFQIEKASEQKNEEQEKVIHSGNGFGGETGFQVVDSGYSAEKYYWVDNERLIFSRMIIK